jgi:hypothetical protein
MLQLLLLFFLPMTQLKLSAKFPSLDKQSPIIQYAIQKLAAVHLARYSFSSEDERSIAVKYLTNRKQCWMNYAIALAKYNKDQMPFHA